MLRFKKHNVPGNLKEINMRAFEVNGKTFSGYLAIPKNGSGPGVVVLHAWWGLTEPFQRVCDRLAQAGIRSVSSRPLPRQDDRLRRGSGGVGLRHWIRTRSDGVATSRPRSSSCASRRANTGRRSRETCFRWLLARRRLRAGHLSQPIRGDRRRRGLLWLLPRPGL